jgi:amino acid adenylation domain-containing protein
MDLLPESVGETLCLDALQQPQDAPPSLVSVNQTNLAYVIFTSGSTGKPKGVQIPHRALINFFEAMQNEPGLSAADILLAVTTVSFDIAGLELLLPLYTGGTVCIALQPGNPEALLHDLARYRPTMMQATPATWKLLIAAGWQGDSRMKILCGGEAMEPALARSLLVRSEELWNMYGPTETTIWSAAYRVESAEHEAIPVGRPIQNTSFYVLDSTSQPVPEGVAGELWIGGEGLARGYLNRPDMTAERFPRCPFAQDTDARMYRTGDLVRYRSDGTLDFYGRLDHQVKLRGFRIELGEIENTLRNCDGVQDAVTLVREEGGEKRLVAYVIYAGDEPPSHFPLRDRLRESLPEYMVPAAFLFLKEFPRLPNGKLDRSALPAPEVSASEGRDALHAPATGLQQTVAQVFRNVLAIERVGLDDNFFDLGAHSLQMVKAHADLNQRIERPISLISFFQYPNVRALSAFIEQSGENVSKFAAQAGES